MKDYCCTHSWPIGQELSLVKLIPAVRHQADGNQKNWSKRSALQCNTPSLTRQEYRTEADINELLKRFGVTTRIPVWGQTVDFNLDLQTALAAIRDVKRAYRDLPDNLREKYKSWQSLMNAIDQGRLSLHREEPPKPPEPAAPPVPPPAAPAPPKA